MSWGYVARITILAGWKQNKHHPFFTEGVGMMLILALKPLHCVGYFNLCIGYLVDLFERLAANAGKISHAFLKMKVRGIDKFRIGYFGVDLEAGDELVHLLLNLGPERWMLGQQAGDQKQAVSNMSGFVAF